MFHNNAYIIDSGIYISDIAPENGDCLALNSTMIKAIPCSTESRYYACGFNGEKNYSGLSNCCLNYSLDLFTYIVCSYTICCKCCQSTAKLPLK